MIICDFLLLVIDSEAIAQACASSLTWTLRNAKTINIKQHFVHSETQSDLICNIQSTLTWASLTLERIARNEQHFKWGIKLLITKMQWIAILTTSMKQKNVQIWLHSFVDNRKEWTEWNRMECNHTSRSKLPLQNLFKDINYINSSVVINSKDSMSIYSVDTNDTPACLIWS